MAGHKFAYRWRLADGFPAPGIEDHRSTVFGTFICGGGSTMGYKLAGFHHLGGVEIDPKVAEVYRRNHGPRHLFVEDLRKFNTREDLPAELYDLDVLDGSPPCSTFSMAGKREKTWGKKKVFHEGQAEQTLDDLVFVYCDTIAKLRPRVCLLENVAGIVKGNARSYCRRILARLDDAGYRVQVFVLNAATMGVPQTRQRTFFIGVRKDFDVPKLRIDVNEPPIKFGEIIDDTDKSCGLSDVILARWKLRKSGDCSLEDVNTREFGVVRNFNWTFCKRDRVAPTLTSCEFHLSFDYPRKINGVERIRIQTFPSDYQADAKDVPFLTGMSVPPVMMAHIADAIARQWLRPIHGRNETQRKETKRT